MIEIDPEIQQLQFYIKYAAVPLLFYIPFVYFIYVTKKPFKTLILGFGLGLLSGAVTFVGVYNKDIWSSNIRILAAMLAFFAVFMLTSMAIILVQIQQIAVTKFINDLASHRIASRRNKK